MAAAPSFGATCCSSTTTCPTLYVSVSEGLCVYLKRVTNSPPPLAGLGLLCGLDLVDRRRDAILSAQPVPHPPSLSEKACGLCRLRRPLYHFLFPLPNPCALRCFDNQRIHQRGKLLPRGLLSNRICTDIHTTSSLHLWDTNLPLCLLGQFQAIATCELPVSAPHLEQVSLTYFSFM